jgi:SAM-dependent methyltransferase
MADEGYLLDNRAVEASGRFDALSAVFDAVTFRHVDALGPVAGWRCWEVGAGGPSVPDGLAERVGPTGLVVATDLDTNWLADRVRPGIEVVQHDVATDEPPAGGRFDLIHARLVLLHIPERDKALRRMVSALRPGGVLLIEDFDIDLQTMLCPDAHGPDQVLANRIKDAFRALLFSRGVDPTFGRRLPRILREHGLVDVIADAYFPLAVPAVAALERVNTAQVRDGLVARGITAAEIDRFLSLLGAGRLDLATAPLISATGRRPHGDAGQP